MSENKKLIIGAVALMLIVAIWYFGFRMTKDKAIDLIISAKKDRTASALNQLDDDFLISWAKSIRSKSSIFSYKNKKYSTSTAKAI